MADGDIITLEIAMRIKRSERWLDEERIEALRDRDAEALGVLARAGVPLTQSEAGVVLGLSRERVSQIEGRALAKFRVALADLA